MAHILLVDDDDMSLKIGRSILQKAGHSVTLAKDGDAALQILDQELFDMVVTDANMPNGLSGYSLASAVRKNERINNIPLIFLTGLTDKADVSRALACGADDYVVKPIDPETLANKVSLLLNKKKDIYGFKVAPIEASGMWQIEFEIISMSEKGLQIVSRASAIPQTKLRIDSDLFETLSIRPPQVRVMSCSPMQNKPAFLIEVSFVGLSQTELQIVKRWVGQSAGAKQTAS